MKKSLMLLLILIVSPAFAGGGSSIGVGNPASENCVQLGGTLEPFETPQGQAAHCVIEEWKLYEAMSSQNLLKEHHYGPGGMPNPSAVNCDDIQGTLRYVETAQGTAGYCVIEEWALYDVFNASKSN